MVVSAAAVLEALRSRGARLIVIEGDRIGVEPRRALDDDLRAGIRRHRGALLHLLEPPAARLDRAWQDAVRRACHGFAGTGRTASLEDLAGAATLELRSLEPEPRWSQRMRRGGRGAFASISAARNLLPEVYRGELIARLGADGMAHVGLSLDALELDPGPPPEPMPPPGKMRCRGCLEVMPEHRLGTCLPCALGCVPEIPSRFMPAALELLERDGPARVRGARQAAIEELTRKLTRQRRLTHAVLNSIEPPARGQEELPLEEPS